MSSTHDPDHIRIRPSVFNQAADWIETHGWYRGDYFPGMTDGDFLGIVDVAEHIRLEKTPCCVLGAVYAASPTDSIPFITAHTDYLARMVARDEKADAFDLPDWNDKPSQRKERVVAALRRAAAQAAKDYA